MRKIMLLCFLGGLFTLAHIQIGHAFGSGIISKNLAGMGVFKAIYGKDDRYNVASYRDARFREYALSVAAMVSKTRLYNKETHFDFYKATAHEDLAWCKMEPFSKEYALGRCSGFLVGDNVLVTAGHCIKNKDQCKNYSWVFNFTSKSEKFSKDQVYGCKKIISRKYRKSFIKMYDYAVIRLDRKVKGRSPLKYRKKSRPSKRTKLVMIGHPAGLPQKISDNARIKFRWWNYFRADLDSFSGNSGSPVFNQTTGKVEGILIRGKIDFKIIYDQPNHMACLVSKKYESSDAREMVFRITAIKRVLKRATRK